MATDLARYAVANARARSLLGRLIGGQGLEALAGQPSAGAVVDALQQTPYAAALAPAGVRAERALAERAAVVGRILLRTLHDPERAFLHRYLLHHEVDNLKVLVRGVAAQLPAERLRPHLVALDGVGTLDLEPLLASKDIPDLVDRLATSPYAGPLRQALPQWRTTGPFALEVAIELDFYDRLWAATATLTSRDRDAVRGLLGPLFDVLNLSWIVRYREACGLSPEETLAYTLRQGRWLTTRRRRELATLPARNWDQPLQRTPYAAAFAPDVNFERPALELTRMVAAAAQSACAGYPFHLGVPLACVMSYEIEIRDLQRILAAKALGAGGAGGSGLVATVRH